MNMRERCERAEAYRKNGANCAQALLAAFADVMGITETQALAVGAGLGGGVRSGNICGAVNAPVMILGCAFPEMAASKAKSAEITKEYQRRFMERFKHLNCRELLAEKELQPTDTAMALAAGITAGCLFSARRRYCAG